jgi:hypothetical protein
MKRLVFASVIISLFLFGCTALYTLDAQNKGCNYLSEYEVNKHIKGDYSAGLVMEVDPSGCLIVFNRTDRSYGYFGLTVYDFSKNDTQALEEKYKQDCREFRTTKTQHTIDETDEIGDRTCKIEHHYPGSDALEVIFLKGEKMISLKSSDYESGFSGLMELAKLVESRI